MSDRTLEQLPMSETIRDGRATEMSAGNDVDVSALRQKWALIERLGKAAHVTLAALRTSIALAPFDEDARSMSPEAREETAANFKAISAQAESARAQVNIFIEGVLRHSQSLCLRLQDAGDAKENVSEQRHASTHTSRRKEEDFARELDNLGVPAEERAESQFLRDAHQLSIKSPQEPKMNNARRAYVDSLQNLENGEGMTIMGLSSRGGGAEAQKGTEERRWGSSTTAQPQEYTTNVSGRMSYREEAAERIGNAEQGTEDKRPLAPDSPAPASPYFLNSRTREWICVNCTLANQGPTDTCAACSSLRGRGSRATGRGKGNSVAEALKAHRERAGRRFVPKGGLGFPAASEWTCSVCTLINTRGGHVCAACGILREQRAPPETEQRRRISGQVGVEEGVENLELSDTLIGQRKR